MNHKKAIIYGLLIWAFVFTIAMLSFPLRANERPLFESIMPVSLVLATTYASISYLKTVTKRYAYIGLCLGIIWFIVSMLLDAAMYSWGPMKMTFMDYIKDIGVTYLLIIMIPSGVGYALQNKEHKI